MGAGLPLSSTSQSVRIFRFLASVYVQFVDASPDVTLLVLVATGSETNNKENLMDVCVSTAVD